MQPITVDEAIDEIHEQNRKIMAPFIAEVARCRSDRDRISADQERLKHKIRAAQAELQEIDARIRAHAVAAAFGDGKAIKEVSLARTRQGNIVGDLSNLEVAAEVLAKQQNNAEKIVDLAVGTCSHMSSRHRYPQN